MRNTRKSGQILRSKKRPHPTGKSGREGRINSNTSYQFQARVIEATVPTPPPVASENWISGARIGQSGLYPAVPTSWSIVGQRDFDGDGSSDFLWRDSSGSTAIWLINGLQISQAGGLGNIPTTWAAPPPHPPIMTELIRFLMVRS